MWTYNKVLQYPVNIKHFTDKNLSDEENTFLKKSRDSVKYIIAPKAQFIPQYSEKIEDLVHSESTKVKTKEVITFLSFIITSQQITYLKTMEKSKIYRQIDFIIQEFFCKIDQYTLTNLLNIINEFMGLLDYSKKLEKESNNQDTILLNEKTSERIEKFKKSQKNTKVL